MRPAGRHDLTSPGVPPDLAPRVAAGAASGPARDTGPGIPSDDGAAHRTAAVTGSVAGAAAARDQVRSLVRSHWRGPEGEASETAVVDLLLVVSELVSNAIRHGGGLARFEAALVADGVRLEVHDHSDTVPAAAFGPGRLPLPHEGGGYGWPLIIRLTREIRVRRRPGGGKTIDVLVPLY